MTVGAEQALERLKNLGEIEFSDNDNSALKIAREKRNEVTHFEFMIDEKEARVVIGNMLVFIFHFSLDELDLNWSQRRLDDPKWSKLREYESFYKAQLEHIEEKIDGEGICVITCPTCYNHTFDVEAEICLLCGHREDVLFCRVCKGEYLYSAVEYEEAELCESCEWKEGFAAANHEKY